MPDGGADKIRKGRKFDQVLAGAREIFMSDGFEGASVDDIAKAAGVSKATLYSYFPDKRLLFLEVAKEECRAQSQTALAEIEGKGDAREVLGDVARRMMRFFFSDVGIEVHRIIVAESQRFPEIGRQFYESGPGQLRESLVAFLTEACATGEMRIEDVQLAADQFPELCKAGLHQQMILGLRPPPSEAEIDRVVEGAVEMFMCSYGARG